MAWAELSDCRCFYDVVGEGEPLLLIPGLGTTSRTWEPIIPDLSEFFSLICLDNRGVGQSVARRTPESLCDLVSDIVELLDHLQLDRAHVMGVSLGGVIAQRLAVDHPSRVDRLVLVSCADSFSPYLRQMSSLLAHSLRKFPKEMFVRMMELLGTAPEFLDANADLIEQRVKNKVATWVSPRAIGNQLRCVASAELEPQHYRITAPTLVVAGEFDPIIPSCYAQRMAEKIPASRFKLIAGAGHNPIVDHPHLALPVVIDFLRGKESDVMDEGSVESFVPYFGGLAPPVEVQGGDIR